jgi:hypothetical protein
VIRRRSAGWWALLLVLALPMFIAACATSSAQDMVTAVPGTTLSQPVSTTRVPTTALPQPTTTVAASTTASAAVSTTTTIAPTTTTAAPTTTLVTIAGIPWKDALDHVSNGSPTFLNIGLEYPDPARFQVVIWGEDRARFPDAPEDMYRGARIAVTGTVKNYEGVAEIIVRKPGQIRVY